ncbi:septal ring lytic transglycosylase RlpA family protein [candidate division KSB1 bacterium]|nr:septal ring lytic transglycosylase RlpA family protein [candidate division KSB1 bacterium]
MLIGGCAHRSVSEKKADEQGYVYIPDVKEPEPIKKDESVDKIITEAGKESVLKQHQNPPKVTASQIVDAPAGTAEALGFYYIKPHKLTPQEIAKLTEPDVVAAEERPIPNGLIGDIQFGKASFYADKFQGEQTASGERYDRNLLTAANRTLPFGTLCEVTNMANGKKVTVKINDRGPFSKGRIIDLSYRAMSILGGIDDGIIQVKVEVVE